MGDSWKKRFSYDEMKDFLELKYEQFNNPSFIECDPVSVPHKYTLKQDIEIYDIKEDEVVEDNNLFLLIKKLDKGDGADLNEIIEMSNKELNKESNKENTEKIINSMIKVGELFEIRPGKIKILE